MGGVVGAAAAALRGGSFVEAGLARASPRL